MAFLNRGRWKPWRVRSRTRRWPETSEHHSIAVINITQLTVAETVRVSSALIWKSCDTMTGLLFLPTELIVHIFVSSPVHTAARLASAIKELHSIWLKHLRYILQNFARSIPAYGPAVELADFHDKYLSPQQHIPDRAQPLSADEAPAILYLRRLLRDASLASISVAAWKTDIEANSYGKTWMQEISLIYMYTSYYFIRKIVLLYHSRDERHQRKLLEILTATPEIIARVDHDFVVLLSGLGNGGRFENVVPKNVVLAHEIWKDEGDMVSGDYQTLRGFRPEWAYAWEVTEEAKYLTERRPRTANDLRLLESVITEGPFTRTLMYSFRR
jgi:hypothetical protein